MAAFIDDTGTGTNLYVNSRPAGAPAAWTVEHANQFLAGSPTTITDVCIAVQDLLGTHPSATVWFAADYGGLPGGAYASEFFSVTPTSAGGSFNHQIITLNTPVTVSGVYWCGITYNCVPAGGSVSPRQGINPRVQGQAAINLQGYGWYTYDNWGTTFTTQAGYIGKSPVIRPLNVQPGGQRVVASPTSGLVTSENGTTATFNVSLFGLKPPTSDVYIDIGSGDPSEISVSPSQLMFNQFNWLTPQPVTLTGVDDPIADGDVFVPIALNIAPLTGDPCWRFVPVAQVSATNLDNEAPCSGGWTQIQFPGIGSQPPAARSSHAMCYDASNRAVLLFGGQNAAGTLLGDTWLYDGTRWTIQSNTGPSARAGHAMAFDSVRGRVVLFGGRTSAGSWSGETWEWSGSSWALRATTGPAPREGAALAFDSNRARTVLFSGVTGGSSYPSETWDWDGSAWTPYLIPMPPPRAHMAYCYDSMNRAVRIHGGENVPSTTFGDTQGFNGIGWSPAAPLLPQAIGYHSGTFDSGRNRFMMFGGASTGMLTSPYGETWELTPSGWMLAVAAGPGAPSARISHAMAYDPRRGVTVLFGGIDATGTVKRDTWEYSRGAAPTVSSPMAPRIRIDPGNAITLSINSVGAISFEWRKDGLPVLPLPHLSGINSATLTIGGALLHDAGVYTCVASNACGEAESAPTILEVHCVADYVDGAGNPPPDGGVGIEDLLHYLTIYTGGSLDADVDDGTGTGTWDGGVGIEDLLYFLDHYSLGC
jgi:hypothetical protein